MKNENEIEIKLPKGYMNVYVTLDNYLHSDTNDSTNWGTLKFPLPKGKWGIKKIDNEEVTLINKKRTLWSIIKSLFK